MIITAAIAMMLAGQQIPYDAQDQVDQQVDQRAMQEMQGDVPQIMPQPQVMMADPSKRQMRDMARGLESIGDAYEVYGRCAGSMTPSGVETTLRAAQASPAAALLLGRYEKGFRKPKGDGWCQKEMARIGG